MVLDIGPDAAKAKAAVEALEKAGVIVEVEK